MTSGLSSRRSGKLPKDKTVFILFYTIHDVLRMEKILKEKGIMHELVPVPRNLSSDCGMCIKLIDDVERARPHLEGFEVERSFSFDGENYDPITL